MKAVALCPSFGGYGVCGPVRFLSSLALAALFLGPPSLDALLPLGQAAEVATSVTAWGSNYSGQTTVPSSLTNAVAIAGGGEHSLALKPDGKVVAWGNNVSGQVTVPASLTNVTALAAGGVHSLALKADGTVVAWGNNTYGQVTVPAGLTNVTSIAGGGSHSLALKVDGTVVAWGKYYNGAGYYAPATVPLGLGNAVAIASGNEHSLVLKADGAVMAWGKYYNGTGYAVMTVPANVGQAVAIAAGSSHGTALGRSAPMINVAPRDQIVPVGAVANLMVMAAGATPITFIWLLNGEVIPGATNRILMLPDVQLGQAGAYSVVVSNGYGSVTSHEAVLTVAPLVITQPPLSQDVLLGSTTSLSVTAVGTGPMTFQWFFNGMAIPDATNRTLMFPSFQFGQAGAYSIVVSNVHGAATGRAADLSVKVIMGWGGNDYGQTTVPVGLTNVLAIAGGVNHGLALKADRKVVVWGDKSRGQAGVPAAATNVTAIAGGGYHSLALRADGRVVAWGDNASGQSLVPAAATNVVGVAGGWIHSLALKANGRVIAWGDNSYGQRAVPASLTNVVAVAGGDQHSLALKADGIVVAWGNNSYGQVTVPADLKDVTAIAAGGYHCLALKADGRVVAWGDNGHGQGVVPGGLTNVIGIACGAYHSLALRTDGTVIAWGNNTYGQTTAPSGLTNVSAIAAAGFYSLSLERLAVAITGPPQSETVPAGATANFSVAASGPGPMTFSWLRNRTPIADATNSTLTLPDVQFAQAGDYQAVVSSMYGASTSKVAVLTVVPVLITASPRSQDVTLCTTVNLSVTAVGAEPMTFYWLFEGLPIPDATNRMLTLASIQFGEGGTYSVVVSNAYGAVTSGEATLAINTIAAWGRNSDGQTTIPKGLTNAVAIAGGWGHSLALKADGMVVAWGANDSGQITIPAGATNVVAIAGGGNHSLALKADGSVAAWGLNSAGQTAVPVGLTNVMAIAAGYGHSLALKADGTVVGWGANASGQITIPAGVMNVVAIAAGSYHSLALKADGTVVAWGYSGFGQAVVPAGLANVMAIAGGAYHSLALKADGSAVAWGQFYDSSHDFWAPMTIPSGNVVAIAGGGDHGLALKADGTVVGAGYYDRGQRSVPEGLRNVVAIAEGEYHSLALVSSSLSPKLLLWALGEDGFTAVFSSVPGGRYVVEFTEDWEQWTPFPVVTATSAETSFRDPAAVGRAVRFYRVKGN